MLKFYTEILGFEIEYRQSDKYISFIFENGARLGIKKATEEREIPGYQTVFISIDNITSYFNSIKRNDVEICKELVEKDYGIEFSLLDPDKNKILFIQRKQ